MRPTAVAALAIATLVPLLGPGMAAPAYQLVIACPPGELTAPVTDNSYNTCPIKAVDSDDIMGSPSLDVDPRNLDDLVLASLHGIPADKGATERSRTRETFTTFISHDHGGTWSDSPFRPPQKVGASASGEHPQVLLDRHGHVFVGSLYSTRLEGERYAYVLVVQKFQDMQEADDQQSGDYGAHYLDPVFDGGEVRQFWLAYELYSDTIVTLWEEHATEAGGRDVLGIAWTTPAAKDPFHYHDEATLIGPCKAATNPVIHKAMLYVGCVANATRGYAWDPKAPDGRVDLFRVHPRGGAATYLGASPLVGGRPKLAISHDGRLGLVSTYIDPQGMPKLWAAYGYLEANGTRAAWTSATEYAQGFYVPQPGRHLTEANIQNLAYRENSGAIHLIWKLRAQPPLDALSLTRPLGLLEPQISKSLLALHEEWGVLSQLDLHVGEMANRTAFGGVKPNQDEGIFNDLADGMVQMPPKPYTFRDLPLGDQYQREFIAVGDYGIVVVAEVMELTDLAPPGAPPGPAAPAAFASPAAANSLTMVLSAAGGLAFAGVLAAKLALSRRHSHAGSTAKER